MPVTVSKDYLPLRKVNRTREQQRLEDDEEKCSPNLITKMASNYDNYEKKEDEERTKMLKTGTTPNAPVSFLNGFSFTLNNISSSLLKKTTGLSSSAANTAAAIKHNKFYRDSNHERRPRLVKKCGELNIDVESVPKRKRRLLSDFFNTVLDVRWRWHIFIFIMTFLISWFVFASVWYLIAFFHGDLPVDESLALSQDPNNRNDFTSHFKNHSFSLKATNNETSSANEKQHVPCVHGIHDFTSALLYSVETQHTIGYGLRHITEECPFAILFLMLQSCFGIFVQGLVAGVVFAKISRPNKRKRTIIFSHNAVVSERDGRLVLMFKIGNVRISQLSDAKLRMLMVKSRVTSDGEFIPFQTYNMKVGYDWSGNESIFFPWPKTVEHVIDSSSPFYEICKQVIENPNKRSVSETECETDSTQQQATETTVFTTSDDAMPIGTLGERLLRRNKSGMSQSTSPTSNALKNIDYEIVVMLEGNIETTGASCHIRTSYLPQEILFGYRFVPIYPKFNKFEYLFDFSKFDQVEPVQPSLFHLNVDHQLNKTVYDAKKEDKNYQLTFQNTLHNGRYLSESEKLQKPVSILTILSAFKAHEQQKEKERIVEEGEKSTCGNDTVLYMDDVDGLEAAEKDTGAKTSRTQCNGRFTVVPVQEKLLIVRKKPNLKRINTMTPNKFIKAKTLGRQKRANSTPPAISFCDRLDPNAAAVPTSSTAIERDKSLSDSSAADDEGYPPSFKQFGCESALIKDLHV